MAALLGGTPARAAIVLLDFDFVASRYFSANAGAPPPPFDPVAVSLSFSFDNAADIDAAVTGMTINGFGLPAALYAPRFSYDQMSDTILFADNGDHSSCGAGVGNDQFCSTISNASTDPAIDTLYYSVSANGTIYFPRDVQYRVVGLFVPEPEIWAMMMAGFGLIGGVQRYHGRRLAAFRRRSGTIA
ncbi:PEPxxWA-CTERM sorting domain-containing protein [Sphingomonas sp.]|uniref:PEPxxWA-CTERM sorting domain-containing protein n=1 Tax=Sphingomonas sp. TaxID=28214 RepID=UPI000DB7CC64|nr:PEPxxWA-CTERM sorting domain-containing protein [Sphingomonas sp.]PZU08674.1 MAG: hypothetical protein DI605_12085 [Sphingomonas sp.]